MSIIRIKCLMFFRLKLFLPAKILSPTWSLFNQLTGADKIRAGLCDFQLKI